MESNQRTAPNFLHKGQGKSTHLQAQMKRVFVVFYRQLKIMLTVLFPSIVKPSNTVKL